MEEERKIVNKEDNGKDYEKALRAVQGDLLEALESFSLCNCVLDHEDFEGRMGSLKEDNMYSVMMKFKEVFGKGFESLNEALNRTYKTL